MAASSKGGESSSGDMVLHQKQLRYMRIVEVRSTNDVVALADVKQEMNSKRLKKEPFEICRAFEEAVKGDSVSHLTSIDPLSSPIIQKHPQLSISYNLLAHLTQEPSQQAGDASSPSVPVQERQYASAYLGDLNSSQAVSLRGRLVSGAKRYLEKECV
jgi:nuclear pore complex protein Nup93